MKGTMRQAGYLLMGILAMVVLSGCPPVTPIGQVTVTPATADVEVDQTITLEAESNRSIDTTFTWTSSNPAVVAVDQTTGTSITIHGVAPGTATITATGSGSTEEGTALITVPEEVEQPGTIQPALQAAGLNVTITGVTVPADRKPEVTFTATNTKGQTIAKSELNALRVILTHLEPAEEGATPKFASYTVNGTNGQATYDSAQLNGLTQLADGSFKYKFATAIPAGYDTSAVHQVGFQIARLYAIDNLTYPANPIYTFRPNGATPVVGRDIVRTETCNKCHTRLEFHGGQRREMQLCITCHQPQSIDPESGNSVDMTEMIHKIHMGEQLPSVEGGTPYHIVGFGGTDYDYSNIAFPQRIANCETCHDETKATQADVWRKNPTIEACGSCHDRTWFGDRDATPEGFTDHPLEYEGGMDNSDCSICHTSGTTGVSPISVRHAALTEPGIVTQILDVNPIDATGQVQVQFKLTYANGSPITNVKSPDRVGAIVAWPTTDYQNHVSETLGGARAITGAIDTYTSETGVYNYTFKATFPTDTEETFGIVMTGRIAATGNPDVELGTLDNSLHYFTFNSAEIVERRQVVDEAKCDACHNEIRGHGEQRFGVDTCVMCHRPNESEGDESINLKDMLHSVHRGADLEFFEDYELLDLEHVHFPGKLQQCTMCHIPGTSTVLGTHEVPLPDEALPSIVGEEQIPATRAACVTCHDSVAADTHAFVNASPQGVESCAVCHGRTGSASVTAVHQLAP